MRDARTSQSPIPTAVQRKKPRAAVPPVAHLVEMAVVVVPANVANFAQVRKRRASILHLKNLGDTAQDVGRAGGWLGRGRQDELGPRCPRSEQHLRPTAVGRASRGLESRAVTRTKWRWSNCEEGLGLVLRRRPGGQRLAW